MLPRSYFSVAETWLSLLGERVGMTPELCETRQLRPSRLISRKRQPRPMGFSRDFHGGSSLKGECPVVGMGSAVSERTHRRGKGGRNPAMISF